MTMYLNLILTFLLAVPIYDDQKLPLEIPDGNRNMLTSNPNVFLLEEDTILVEGLKIMPIAKSKSNWLPYLEQELEKYPKDLLNEYNIEVYLVGWIVPSQEDVGFFSDKGFVLGTYSLTKNKNCVYLVPHVNVREILHHELNSVLFQVKSQNNEEFKELLNSYCGYFESVSNYTHDNWFQPLKTHELYLGPSHYAQVDCENDMNVIAVDNTIR